MVTGALVVQLRLQLQLPRRSLPPQPRNIPHRRRPLPPHTRRLLRKRPRLHPHRLPVRARAPLSHPTWPLLPTPRPSHTRLPRLVRPQLLPYPPTAPSLPVVLLSRLELLLIMGRPRTSKPYSISLSPSVPWLSLPSPSCSLGRQGVRRIHIPSAICPLPYYFIGYMLVIYIVLSCAGLALFPA